MAEVHCTSDVDVLVMEQRDSGRVRSKAWSGLCALWGGQPLLGPMPPDLDGGADFGCATGP